MALREFRCLLCGVSGLAFPEEAERVAGIFKTDNTSCVHSIYMVPQRPNVVMATEQFMVDGGFYLDSMGSIYELDRILNVEARTEKEMKFLETARKNA